MPSLAMATTRNVEWGGDPYGEGKARRSYGVVRLGNVTATTRNVEWGGDPYGDGKARCSHGKAR